MLTVKFSVGSGKAPYVHITEILALQTRFCRDGSRPHQLYNTTKSKDKKATVCVYIYTHKLNLASFTQKLLTDLGSVILVGIA